MSLRVRLVAMLGVSLVLIWSTVAIWMLVDLNNEVSGSLDKRLEASAKMVAGLVGQMQAIGPSDGHKARSTVNIIARDGIECEVSLVRGQVTIDLARTEGAPDLGGLSPGYAMYEHGGKVWRTFILVDRGLRIATADPLDSRLELSRDITLAVAVPFAMALLGSLLVLWFGVGRGLSPIERVRARLATMGPTDSTPIEMPGVPPELKPLVGTVNHLLLRVRSMVARERRFVDDAAHELRTPLTAIKTHLQVLRIVRCAPTERETAETALDSAEEGVKRLHYTLEQLLLLARLENGSDNDIDGTSRVAACAELVLREVGILPGARSRLDGNIEVRPDAYTRVPSPLLVVALRNLLENALRYSPAEAPVMLRVSCTADDKVVFMVADHGPGLSEQDRRLALQRFWRRAGSPGTGSGMGLSIVSAIAERHDGILELLPRAGATGLIVKLTFPCVTLDSYDGADAHAPTLV